MVTDSQRYLQIKRFILQKGPLFLILVMAAYLGYTGSARWGMLLAAGLGTLALLQHPKLGLFALIPGALVIPFTLWVGAVEINATVVLIAGTLVVWLLNRMQHRTLTLRNSRTNRPLLLFLLAALLSWFVGNALWRPAVPRPGYMSMAQVAQWALFALSAGIYWLMANLVKGEKPLRRLTFLFLGLNGILIGPSVLSRGQIDLEPITTLAFSRAPLWALVAALALGQLLFNQRLNLFWRLFLGITFFTVVLSTFWFQRQAASRWIGVAAVIGVLFWLRWPRWRLPTLVLLVILIITGSLTSSLYEFAGGDAEWIESGGSRLVLITRVIEVTLYNPITGLGPASYRAYAGMEPIQYGRALWVNPLVNSHNNYVDLFAHTGLLGLGLFLWFMAEVTLLGWRLSRTYRSGFLGGYVSAMTATCISSLVLMLLADWILPFIYNVGYSGFQASALVWFFLGGLVTVENLAETKMGSMESDETVDNHR